MKLTQISKTLQDPGGGLRVAACGSWPGWWSHRHNERQNQLGRERLNTPANATSLPSLSSVPHIVVTGANGFIAQRLLQQHLLPLLAKGQVRLSLTDLHAPSVPIAGVRFISGDIGDDAVWHDLMSEPVDLLFHFAAVVSGRAEADYALGLHVNLHATLAGLAHCREQQRQGGPRVRWVQASSIGVFGPPLPARMDDQTPVLPALSYGAHKRMVELMLDDLSRRGHVDGRCLRLSGVVVRPPAPNGALSGFNSDLIREPLAGRRIVCPVLPSACMWLCSASTTADQLWQLSQIEAATWQQRNATHRTGGVVNAPTWPVRVSRLIEALGRIDPEAPSRIEFDPLAPLQAQFGNWPETVDFAFARALGLPDDQVLCQGDLVQFVRNSMDTVYA